MTTHPDLLKPVLTIAFLVLLLLTGSPGGATQAAASTPVAATSTAIALTLDVDTPVDAVFGYVRTTIAPGGSVSFSAGSGPAVQYVEHGAIQVSGQDVLLTTADVSGGASAAADDLVIESGTLFAIPAGGSVEIRNQEAAPATILELFSASDAAVNTEVDVTHLLLARRDYPLPQGGVTLALSQHTLAPGEQFAWPAEPAVTTLYPLERSDAFLLTGKGVNRGDHPIALYAVTIAPVSA